MENETKKDTSKKLLLNLLENQLNKASILLSEGEPSTEQIKHFTSLVQDIGEILWCKLGILASEHTESEEVRKQFALSISYILYQLGTDHDGHVREHPEWFKEFAATKPMWPVMVGAKPTAAKQDAVEIPKSISLGKGNVNNAGNSRLAPKSGLQLLVRQLAYYQSINVDPKKWEVPKPDNIPFSLQLPAPGEIPAPFSNPRPYLFTPERFQEIHDYADHYFMNLVSQIQNARENKSVEETQEPESKEKKVSSFDKKTLKEWELTFLRPTFAAFPELFIGNSVFYEKPPPYDSPLTFPKIRESVIEKIINAIKNDPMLYKNKSQKN